MEYELIMSMYIPPPIRWAEWSMNGLYVLPFRDSMKFLNPIFFEPLSAHCNSVSATRKDNRDTVVSGRTFTESGGERPLEGALRRKRFPLRVLPDLGFPNKRLSALPKAARAQRPPTGRCFPSFPISA